MAIIQIIGFPPSGNALNRNVQIQFEDLINQLNTNSSLFAPYNATFVTLSTNSTLSSERVLTGTSNQIVITDNGAGSTVVLSLPQNIHTAATPTFASETLTATTNQLVLGTTRTVTITAPTPATSSRTWTIPDISGNGTFAALEATQTFSGTNTFSNTITVSKSAAGANVSVDVTNSDNTSGTSHARLTASAGGTSGGDAYVQVGITSGTTWSLGADNSDSDKFKVSRATTLGTNDDIIISSTTDAVYTKGTNTNDSPAAGYVGEIVTSTVTTFANITTTATFQNITSISLTAGHWIVAGAGAFTLNGATGAAQVQVVISQFTGNTTTDHAYGDNLFRQTGPTANTDPSVTIPNYEIKLSGSATVYLKGVTNFTAGNPQFAGRITATRLP